MLNERHKSGNASLHNVLAVKPSKWRFPAFRNLSDDILYKAQKGKKEKLGKGSNAKIDT